MIVFIITYWRVIIFEKHASEHKFTQTCFEYNLLCNFFTYSEMYVLNLYI